MSKDLLLKIFEKVRQKRLIDEDFINFLELIFPDKSSDVIKALKRGITKYTYKPSNRVVWTAMGRNQEHLIYPKLFCSCQDYYKNVVVIRNREFCKHIIAQIISEALGNFKETTLDDKKFKELVSELKLKI
jgi:predicted nucleic acid-binding Zn finger protein